MDEDRLLTMQSLLRVIELDVAKARAGNKAAGTRARGNLQKLKVKAGELRVEILEKRKEAGR